MAASHLQIISRHAAFGVSAALTLALLTSCGSVPVLPKQVQEYQRHSSVGFEKFQAGQIGEARSAFNRAVARAELDDDAALIAAALLSLGATELLLDNNESAGRSYARASREARLAGNPAYDWQAISGLAEATRRLGQPAKALELFAARPDTGKALTDPVRIPAEVARARALADSGQSESALQLLATLESAARALPSPHPALALCFHAKATVLLGAGRSTDALPPARAALELDRQLHHPPSVADDHRLLARIALAQTNTPDATDIAKQHLERALAIYRNTGQAGRAAETLKALHPASRAD